MLEKKKQKLKIKKYLNYFLIFLQIIYYSV
jgi:hypothetical protein